MATLFESLDDDLQTFIRAQPMFFVSTAPLSAEGLVNCSPKGMDTFRILDAHTVAYLDLTGSGAETIAHLKENGRCVIMFCSFSNKPRILRLHGKGEVIETHEPAFQDLKAHFPALRGTRAIIRLNVERIADSCGWTVPVMDLVRERDTYAKFTANITDTDMQSAQKESNLRSLDGLPALSRPSEPVSE